MHKTSNTFEAAYLIMNGHPLRGYETKNNVMFFVFDETALQDSDHYFNGVGGFNRFAYEYKGLLYKTKGRKRKEKE